MSKKILLASASPRRKEILLHAGYDLKVIPSYVKEKVHEGITLTPREISMYFSFIKAKSVYEKFMSSEKFADDYFVVGSDTIVVMDNHENEIGESHRFHILGKPEDEDDAFHMLKTLSGKHHYVISGVSIFFPKLNKSKNMPTCLSFAETTKVTFKEYNDDTIKKYISTGDPMDKAGSYGIQGLFKKHIAGYEGSYNNVVGFPVERFTHVINMF